MFFPVRGRARNKKKFYRVRRDDDCDRTPLFKKIIIIIINKRTGEERTIDIINVFNGSYIIRVKNNKFILLGQYDVSYYIDVV